MITPTAFWAIVSFLFGVTIGSFLNAVIYRLPNNLSLLEPKHSICPNCKHTLSAFDLVPLFSFLLIGRRCRYCKKPISWRYFNVELLTGCLFTIIYLHFSAPQEAATAITLLAFTAVLIPVFFIDLATFTIPDSLNILLFVIPVGRDIYGIALHESGHKLLWGWCPLSLLGALAGSLIFGAVRLAGWVWKGVEAMGLGDVLLGRGMGAMLISIVAPGADPLRLLPIWVLLSLLSGIIVGPLLIWLRLKSLPGKNHEPLADEPQETGREGTFAGQITAILWCLVLGDLWAYLYDLVRPRAHIKELSLEDDDWVPAPTAIPFGPFLVVGFLATLFIGEPLTAAYLAFAFRR